MQVLQSLHVLQSFSGLQGFVGAMRCMGRRTAGLCGGDSLRRAHSHFRVHGTHARIILELQGKVWVAMAVWNAPLCEPEDKHPFDNLALRLRLHQFVPLPVSRGKLVPTNLCHCPANDLIANTSWCVPQE